MPQCDISCIQFYFSLQVSYSNAAAAPFSWTSQLISIEDKNEILVVVDFNSIYLHIYHCLIVAYLNLNAYAMKNHADIISFKTLMAVGVVSGCVSCHMSVAITFHLYTISILPIEWRLHGITRKLCIALRTCVCSMKLLIIAWKKSKIHLE